MIKLAICRGRNRTWRLIVSPIFLKQFKLFFVIELLVAARALICVLTWNTVIIRRGKGRCEVQVPLLRPAGLEPRLLGDLILPSPKYPAPPEPRVIILLEFSATGALRRRCESGKKTLSGAPFMSSVNNSNFFCYILRTWSDELFDMFCRINACCSSRKRIREKEAQRDSTCAF